MSDATPPKSAVVKEERGPTGALEVDAELTDNIAALLEAEQRGMVLNLVADLYPADLALLLSHLPFKYAHVVFSWLPPDKASEVLTELDDAFRAALLRESPPGWIARLLQPLDTDDATDVLADLPEDEALQVLPNLRDAPEVHDLLNYPEDTAGGLMAAEYVAVPYEMGVEQATEIVRAHAESVDDVFVVFLIDEDQQLKGVLPIKQILLSPAGTRAIDIAETDFISVTTDIDQEEVGRIMQRYDLVSLPVVDESGRLVGRITIDDVVDVIRAEAEEDLQLMSGVSGDESLMASTFQISRGRLPWLLVGLFGASLSGTVIGTFESALEEAVVLATFIPIVTAMGGNAAVQSAAITVQGLTSGELWEGDALSRLGKELVVALFNGIVLAALLCVFVLLFGMGNVPRLAATLGVTMIAVIVLATTNGAVVPFLLQRFGLDPASAMGPFVTTLNDIIGLTVYFLIALALYL